MILPIPIPDNPLRWDGWKNYTSTNPYERLCLAFDLNPSDEQIEEHCRHLLVWWQKKLPLKNQPSNPLSQLLRGGMDEAPKMLAEAKAELLDPVRRAEIDNACRELLKGAALAELQKFLKFSLIEGVLSDDGERSLHQKGLSLGLDLAQTEDFIAQQLVELGASREKKPEPAPSPASSAQPASNAFDEFKRLLHLSGLTEDDLTDDQRDALCNMGENLGLTGGQAEDLIDEYLETAIGFTPPSSGTSVLAPPTPKPAAAKAVSVPVKSTAEAKPAVGNENREALFNITPLQRAQERERFPNFINSLGQEMILVSTGVFMMGSTAPEAAPNESPVSRTLVNCFCMARYPVTNAQFEQFQPNHRSKRASWANDHHPVVYVNSSEAIKFCEWLSAKENRRYRLPTEAEWEYAARGVDNRPFPWGERLTSGQLANFADANTSFPWRMMNIDDGYAQSSPVGAYPRGASPFGIEDLAGNVWEWCLDSFSDYKGRDQINPRGPLNGARQIYRGGSWKSRASSLRTSARGWNAPNFSSNDVGFRVVCECE